MAVNYNPYRPEVGTNTYIARIDDLITELQSDISALQTVSDGNAAYITAIPTTGFSFNDSVSLTLGSGLDTTISHTGTNTDINHSGFGNLRLINTANIISIEDALTTFNNGITISSGNLNLTTGTITASTFNGNVTGNLTGNVTGNVTGNADTATNATNAADSSLLDGVDSTSFLRSDLADSKTVGNLTFSDNIELIFGASTDLRIFHSTTSGNQFISNSYLSIDAEGLDITNTLNGANTYFRAQDSGGTIRNCIFMGGATPSSALLYNGATKLQTTNTGVTVTGAIDISGDLETTQHNLGIYSGIVNYSGTPSWLRPTGGISGLTWSDQGSGRLRCTHNWGSDDYTVVATSENVADGYIITADSLTTTSYFELQAFNDAGTPVYPGSVQVLIVRRA